MKSILMIVSNPFVSDQRVYSEAQVLINFGYSVSVLAWDRDAKYKEKEVFDEIEVYRIRGDKIDRFLKKRPLQQVWFWRKGYRCLYELQDTSVDVVHCHDLDTLRLGVRLKKKLNCKLIYDSHEIFLYLIQRDLTKYLTWYYRILETRGCKFVDQMIVVDDKHKEYFKTNYSVKNISVVRNTKELISIKYISPPPNGFQLIYIGTLSRPRFILEAIDIIAGLEDVNFVIAGLGPIQNEVKLIASNVKNVKYLGIISFEQIIDLNLKSHVSLCMIDPSDSNNRIGLANKQFEAMVCGRPIIATRGTRVAEITEQENCGLLVDYNKESLKSGILNMKNNPNLRKKLGMNGLNAAKQKYNWDIDSKRLINIYEELLKEGQSS